MNQAIQIRIIMLKLSFETCNQFDSQLKYYTWITKLFHFSIHTHTRLHMHSDRHPCSREETHAINERNIQTTEQAHTTTARAENLRPTARDVNGVWF